MWDYTFFEKLNIDPKDHKIMLTEAPLNPKDNRKKTIQTMFEKYQFAGAHMSIQAMLVLYAQGLLTGVVVDSGDGVTHVVPVYDGFVPQHLIRRLDVAGRHITRYLIKLLLLRGYSFNRTADFETVREIKEKLCYVAYDVQKERALAQDTTVLVEKYKLPDGSEIKIGRERFEAAEALFQPGLVDCEGKGMADMVFDMIQDADIDCRPEAGERRPVRDGADGGLGARGPERGGGGTEPAHALSRRVLAAAATQAQGMGPRPHPPGRGGERSGGSARRPSSRPRAQTASETWGSCATRADSASR